MNANTTKKPVVYACSGCSDVAELTDRVARELTKRGVAEMSCLAGIGGRVKPLMQKAQSAERIIVIDGCPLTCAKHTLMQANIPNFHHIKMHELGLRKGSCPVDEALVQETATAIEEMITAPVALLA